MSSRSPNLVTSFLPSASMTTFVPPLANEPRPGLLGRLLVQRADVNASLVPVGLIAANAPLLELACCDIARPSWALPLILISIRSTKSSTVPCRQTQNVSSFGKFSAVASPTMRPSLTDQIFGSPSQPSRSLPLKIGLKARLIVRGGRRTSPTADRATATVRRCDKQAADRQHARANRRRTNRRGKGAACMQTPLEWKQGSETGNGRNRRRTRARNRPAAVVPILASGGTLGETPLDRQQSATRPPRSTGAA